MHDRERDRRRTRVVLVVVDELVVVETCAGASMWW